MEGSPLLKLGAHVQAQWAKQQRYLRMPHSGACRTDVCSMETLLVQVYRGSAPEQQHVCVQRYCSPGSHERWLREGQFTVYNYRCFSVCRQSGKLHICDAYCTAPSLPGTTRCSVSGAERIGEQVLPLSTRARPNRTQNLAKYEAEVRRLTCYMLHHLVFSRARIQMEWRKWQSLAHGAAVRAAEGISLRTATREWAQALARSHLITTLPWSDAEMRVHLDRYADIVVHYWRILLSRQPGVLAHLPGMVYAVLFILSRGMGETIPKHAWLETYLPEASHLAEFDLFGRTFTKDTNRFMRIMREIYSDISLSRTVLYPPLHVCIDVRPELIARYEAERAACSASPRTSDP